MKINSSDPGGQAPFVSLVKFRNEMGVSDVTAWRWRKRGILTTVNIGGRQYVSHQEVQRFKDRAEAGEFAQESAAPLAKERSNPTCERGTK